MILADLGAEVIRAENPETERDGGFAGPIYEGYSVYYAVYNRGKKSIGLNRSQPEGRELFRRLIPHLDVIVENFRPGYLDKLGFSFDALQALNRGSSSSRSPATARMGRTVTRPRSATWPSRRRAIST